MLSLVPPGIHEFERDDVTGEKVAVLECGAFQLEYGQFLKAKNFRLITYLHIQKPLRHITLGAFGEN